MGAITGTVAKITQLAGSRILVITAPIASNSDEITLTLADHGARVLHAVVGQITGGMDADFCTIQVSHSGLVITIASFQEDGAAADEFTGTTVELICIVD